MADPFALLASGPTLTAPSEVDLPICFETAFVLI